MLFFQNMPLCEYDWWFRAGFEYPSCLAFALISIFIFGSCWGSFMNVCIWRMPRRESVVTAPSHCTACGAEMSRETFETEKLTHTYSAVITDPTCAKDGYTTHTCTACGDSYADTPVPALGHVYSYALTDTPGQVSTGALTGTCGRCADEITIVLPKLNDEDYTHIVTKEPTDTENGTAEYTWNNTEYGTITFEVKLRKLTGLPLGDLDDDGDVDIFDANLVASYYNEIIELDVDQLAAADVNGDGNVNIFDANLIAAYYNEVIDEFPVD